LIVGTLFYEVGLVHDTPADTAASVFLGESVTFLALIGATSVMALIENRSILSYNLTGPRRALHFLFGLAAGFAVLSLLVSALASFGLLRMTASTLSASRGLEIGLLWAAAFFVVGSVEEGLFRCYALATLERGIDFWWALAAQAGICLYLAVRGGHGAWGVYASAGLGLLPCFILHQRAVASNAFWQAAWVTSTIFGLYHTSNGGENWVGVFAAACIGFVFCVGVRLTGSIWWAIGCHAAWDWAETFFYGAADSGIQARGHFLAAAPSGNPFWSGGADGPEGSPLVFAAILLLLLALLASSPISNWRNRSIS